jgi:glycine dehydrogenase subunit 1
VLKLPEGTDIDALNEKLLEEGFIGGYNLSREYPELGSAMLIAVTERRSKEDIDRFAEILEGSL